MAARWKTNARRRIEVIAMRRGAARIIDLTLAVLNHEASFLKIGETLGIAWCPIRQKEIDEFRKLVTDYVPVRKKRRSREKFKQLRYRFGQKGVSYLPLQEPLR